METKQWLKKAEVKSLACQCYSNLFYTGWNENFTLQNARLTKPQLGEDKAVLCALNHGNLVFQGNDP